MLTSLSQLNPSPGKNGFPGWIRLEGQAIDYQSQNGDSLAPPLAFNRIFG
jgi:hypothetical protein